MSRVLNQIISKNNFINALIAFLPLSFIAGNTVINTNILLLIFSVFIFFGKKVFDIKYYFLDKIIFLFFFLILFTGAINDISFVIQEAWMPKFYTTIKSFAFLRFLILYIVIRFLVENNKINFKYFFISCSFFSVFVALDIFLQLIIGKDIFGYQSAGRHFSGPFGNEYIAGSYMQRFSLFTFFLIPIFFQAKLKKILNFILPILFLIFFVAIAISGNRMPLILFLFSIMLIIIFQRQTRKYLISFFITFSLLFILIFQINSKVRDNFKNFYNQVSQISKIIITNDFRTKQAPPYFKEFVTFYDTWLLHKYIGGGIKSFRYNCHHRENIDRTSKFICNMHPHNYYLEILTETGLIGFTLIIIIFTSTLYISLYKKYFAKSHLQENHIITPFIFLLITEIFPIKSTGSFFTTGNSTYFFIIFAMVIALSRTKNF
tara:strand:+ start:320 stop:1618 length:1299 start_codon:yes stop_codon:yes gene_type:complete